MPAFKTLDTAAPDYIVEVKFNSQSLALEVSVDSLSILRGSNLLLRFRNLPAGWSPLAEFRNGDSNVIMTDGPFEQVIVGRDQVLAVSACEDFPEFQFRALIQRGFGIHSQYDAAVIYAKWLPVVVGSDSEEDQLIKIQITEDNGHLMVDKPNIAIRGGMRVQWDFSAVAEDHHQPLVAYGRPLLEDEPGDSQEFFGPHESFVYRGNTLVEGNGNNGVKGIYRYEVYLLDIRTRAIAVWSSMDPQTDNEGDIRGSN